MKKLLMVLLAVFFVLPPAILVWYLVIESAVLEASMIIRTEKMRGLMGVGDGGTVWRKELSAEKVGLKEIVLFWGCVVVQIFKSAIKFWTGEK